MLPDVVALLSLEPLFAWPNVDSRAACTGEPKLADRVLAKDTPLGGCCCDAAVEVVIAEHTVAAAPSVSVEAFANAG